MKVLIVVPCYNEEKNIERTIEGIIEKGYDYVIIDDGSKDASLEIARKNDYHVIHLSNNLGIGGAMQTGYRYAARNGYDVAVQIDGDGQHNVEEVDKLIQPIRDGACSMVIGSRFIDNKGFQSSAMRRVGIRFLSWLMKLFSGQEILDMTSGFRAIDKSLIRRFSDRYPSEYPEPVTNLQVTKLGYKIKEVPAMMNERQQGRSSIFGIKNVYYMLNVIFQLILIQLSGEN